MHFNHLLEERELRRICKNGTKGCYLVPVGNITATAGNNVSLTLECKTCTRREDVFLTEQEYRIQEKIIIKEVENV
jgi:hypothetical protein